MGSLMPGSLRTQRFQKWSIRIESIRIAPSVMTSETHHRAVEVSFASNKEADGKASNQSQCPVSQLKNGGENPEGWFLNFEDF